MRKKPPDVSLINLAKIVLASSKIIFSVCYVSIPIKYIYLLNFITTHLRKAFPFYRTQSINYLQIC